MTILVECSHEHNLVIVSVTNLYIGSHKCDGNEWTKNVDKMSLRLSSQFSHEHLHICKFKMFMGKLGRRPHIHFVNISLYIFPCIYTLDDLATINKFTSDFK